MSDNLAESFKLAMRRLATTVTIITSREGEQPVGMTATAVTSLSAEPPSLLTCVNRSASIHRSLTLGKAVCVNLLSEQHGDLSFAFGGKLKPEERFATEGWAYDPAGTPYLTGAQANIFATVDALFDYATHTIVVSKATSVLLAGEIAPLIYGDGRFIPLPRRADPVLTTGTDVPDRPTSGRSA